MAKDPIKGEDTSQKNVRALMPFMLKGRKVAEGEIVAKSDFPNAQDYRNLLNMNKPRVEETNDKVGAAAKPSKVPGA